MYKITRPLNRSQQLPAAYKQTNNKWLFNCDDRRIERHQWHYQSSWPLNWPIRSITRVSYHQLTWYNSLLLWWWLPQRLLKFSDCQQQSYSVVCSPGQSYSMYLYKITLVSWQVHISCLFSLCVLQPCGVDYELKTYISESPEEKPHKRWPLLKYYFANWNNIESCDALILTALIMDLIFVVTLFIGTQ